MDAASTTALLHPYIGVRERELLRGAVDGEELFVAEGEVVVRVLVMRSSFAVRSLLIETRRIEALRDVIDALPQSVPVYVAPQRVMDGIVGFPIHRGVLALGLRGPVIRPRHLLATCNDKSRPIAIGLVGLANHDNVGGIFRNAAAFGVRAILLDNLCCDPLYRKSLRVSVGGALVVPFARCPSAEAMVDMFEEHGWEVLALSPHGEQELRTLAPAPRRALLLGTEGAGLPFAILQRAHRVRIDMQPTLDSLNVAVTSGIALYEATRSE